MNLSLHEGFKIIKYENVIQVSDQSNELPTTIPLSELNNCSRYQDTINDVGTSNVETG